MSCPELPNAVINRKRNSPTDFTITCVDDKIIESRCEDGVWKSPVPSCDTAPPGTISATSKLGNVSFFGPEIKIQILIC